MADDLSREMLELMIGMEAQLIVMRQMLVFLTAERFSHAEDYGQLLEATSEFMSKAMSAKEAGGSSVSVTERLKAEMDKFLAEVRRALEKPDSSA